MTQQISDRHFRFPLLYLVQIRFRSFPFFVGYDNRVLGKAFTQIIHYPGVQTDLIVRHEFLQCIVDGKHLGQGSQIIERVCRHLRAGFVDLAVRKIGVGLSPGILIDQSAVFDDSQLGAGEAVADVRADQVRDHFQRLGGDAFVLC